ncbi:MAG: dephospho-CoA kinase [Actinomycetia bacterium]|nr:dephospho-CoA kinase [Actinomycetes bacterium]
MLAVGLTGGIASGKSRIAGYFAEYGAKCLDTDLLAQQAIARDTPVFANVRSHFGDKILDKDGSIDRALLAAEVFGNPSQLEVLNRLVHPIVIERVKETLSRWRQENHEIGIVQVPLLVEAGMVGLFDVVVVVSTSPDLQVGRLLKTGLTMEEAQARVASQISESERLTHADLIIINKGTPELLEDQAKIAFEKLRHEQI